MPTKIMKIEEIKPYKNTKSKRQQVEEMFDGIASEYDSLNHNMSLGVDARWRQFVVDYLEINGIWPLRILDVATGTGDLALIASVRLHPDEIIGIDISQEMLRIGKEKTKVARLDDNIHFRKEDCAKMSFEDHSFDAVISAFALRNFENLQQCLNEMYRVTAHGGVIAVIDLCDPRHFPMKQLFKIYQKLIMPIISRRCIKDIEAASYLNQSMKVVPSGKDMAQLFRNAGFINVKYTPLKFGMCYLYTGRKADSAEHWSER